MSEDETRPVRDLLELIYEPNLYAWRASDYSDAPDPVGGDRVHMGAIDMCGIGGEDDWREGARYVEIPDTGWGDYAGGTFHRSNARSLRRDFPDEVITLLGSHGFECLILPLDARISEGLFEAIEGLRDYPVYDESDDSELRTELEQEDWDNWARDDFRSTVRELAQQEDRDDDVTELDDDDRVDSLWWEAIEDGSLYWEAESATSGYWDKDGFRQAAEHVWEAIKAARTAELDEWARELAAPIPGQLTLI